MDKDGETRVKVECIVEKDEKESVWDLLRFTYKRDCPISAEPSEVLFDPTSKIRNDYNSYVLLDAAAGQG